MALPSPTATRRTGRACGPVWCVDVIGLFPLALVDLLALGALVALVARCALVIWLLW
jgi:hypothetical protein